MAFNFMKQNEEPLKLSKLFETRGSSAVTLSED